MIASMVPNWRSVSLDELVALRTGPFGSALHRSDYVPSTIPVVNPMHIKNGRIEPTIDMCVSDEVARRLSEFRLQVGDVVLARRGEMGRCAVVGMREAGWLCGTGSLVLRANAAVNVRFLQRYMSSPSVVRQLEGDSVGSTMVNLNQGILKALPLPVPPINEQERIAEKLDSLLARVDDCRTRLNRVPAILKRFRHAVLEAATSGGLTEDWREGHSPARAWRDCVLSDIADIQGGITKDAKREVSTDVELPYLRVANVQRGWLDLSQIKTIRVPPDKLPALLLRRGDVLFNEGGDIDKLGRGWIWEGQIERCIYQNHVFRARLHDADAQPKFISWWGNSVGLDYFLRAGKQTTNLASINKTVLSNLPILLPSPAEQAEIVRRVDALFALADTLETRLATARDQVDRLTPALLSKAFRGELVPQDPNDEPASALPNCIRRGSASDMPVTARRRHTGEPVA
jgi:type I restriction enzyme S subunit